MLLLASASPARRRLLAQAAIPHQVQVSGVDEEAVANPDPVALVGQLATAKARAVHDRLLGSPQASEFWGVLGCDSLLEVDGAVFGKPVDADDARRRWRRMAGGWGELHTGHCLLADGCGTRLTPSGTAARCTTITTRVQFAALTEAEISAYIASGEPLQCAGGFALEGRGGLHIERIEGCYSNVIGLSLPLLRGWLTELGAWD